MGVQEYEGAMRRALELATRSPSDSVNPRVGCVVLDAAGNTISEGWHRGAGTPHAECDALSKLTPEQAAGSTVVVTLEPCNHVGRTAPCSNTLIAAKVGKVVYGATDPGTFSGGGAKTLEAAGIPTIAGVLLQETTQLIHDWLVCQELGRPHTTLKWASSLDGRAAAADGTSRWISGEQSRAHVHLQRAAADAILVGTGTAQYDDPALTARTASGDLLPKQPQPVIVGFNQPEAPGALAKHPRVVLRYRTHDLATVLVALKQRGIKRVFIEGGPTIASALVAANLVDEYLIYVAPVLLGGPRLALGELAVSTMSEAKRLRLEQTETLGDDILFRLTPLDGHGMVLAADTKAAECDPLEENPTRHIGGN